MAIKDGDADLVAFGRDLLANPDLPYRVRRNLPLNPCDRETLNGGDHRGYTECPIVSTEVNAT
jgi:N-ethylmaleimide reductase